jgi:hypothetical protein
MTNRVEEKMGPIDFFIAGVQKGGTTALDTFLRDHPSIQMASIKEVHFFDDDGIDWTRPDYSRLHGFFDWSSRDVRRGEATPIYFYWPNALARLRQYNPAARLIILLRHPSLRAYSQWRMETKRGNDDLSFADAIGASGRARVVAASNGAHRIFSYVERGFYAGQIRSALSQFPRDQLLFCRTDRLWSDPQTILGEIQDFVGVRRRALADRRYIAPLLTWSKEPITGPVRAMLDATFAPDICETSLLTGLNLEDWLTPNFSEPMAPDENHSCISDIRAR